MSNTLLQPASLLVLAYCGVVIGIIYDIFRLLRRLLLFRAVQAAADILFVIICVVLTAFAVLFATNGAIRGYLFLGLVAGVLLQQWSLSNLFFKLFYRLRRD